MAMTHQRADETLAAALPTKLCDCHNEPMYWHPDPRRLRSGGYWECWITKDLKAKQRRHSMGMVQMGTPEQHARWSAGKLGERNGSWKGAAVSYSGMHMRIRNARGSATNQACAHCQVTPAKQWAFDHANQKPDREERGVAFSSDIEHYIPLCGSCHHRFDSRIENILRKRGI